MQRNSQLEKLKTENFDICIIGAGASGAGVALDAILRGYSVAMIEKVDFSSETSSKSTKLIHGGVRYLEQAFKKLEPSSLKQVKHGLAERQYLLANAPHLAKPLGIITPVFSWIEGLYYTIGLKLYGLFAKNDHLPKAEWLSKSETLRLAPSLNPKINSGVIYYDGQLDDARYVIALVQAAHAKGTVVANYVEAQSFVKNEAGKLTELLVKDTVNNQSFAIKSKIFINCTGPFSDYIRLMANPAEETRIKPAKGVHIMLPKEFFDSEKAMLIPKTKDGRLVFVIPFKSEVMVGTTDTPYKNLEKEPLLVKEEVNFLLETLTPFLKKMPTEADIKSGFGGVRPLLSAKTNNLNETKGLLRDHEVEIDEASGLVSLLGGKWTTYRLMAEDTVNKVGAILKNDKESSTHFHKLWGAQNQQLTKKSFLESNSNIETETLEHLWATYGDQAIEVLKIATSDKALGEKIIEGYPYLKAEVTYGSRYEMVEKPRDYLARRIRVEILDWNLTKAMTPTVAQLIGTELEWTSEKIENEKNEYESLIEGFISAKNKFE